MARKNLSAHSDAQFALFVERMNDMLEGEKKAEFEELVRKLVRTAAKEPEDIADGAMTEIPMRTVHISLSRSQDAAVPSDTRPPTGDLPEPPDFEAIEAAARETYASRSNLMALIGQLVFSSSNNESLLIYVLMVLLQTDEASAATVFSTLNTTRARLDLVSRLARIKVGDRETCLAVEQLVRDFNETNQVRNEFLHAMYTVDAKGAITHTQTMRLISKGGRLSFGQQHAIDQARLDGLVRTCADLRALNKKIWDLLPRLQKAVKAAASGIALSAAVGKPVANGHDVGPTDEEN